MFWEILWVLEISYSEISVLSYINGYDQYKQ